jgi:hypothetical protein
MRRARTLGAVTLVALAGCLPRGGDTLTWGNRRPPGLNLPAAPGAVLVKVALIDQPLGDPFLDRDLWAAGVSPATPETRALLAENGLRAVVLAGILPERFEQLVRSESAVVNPQLLTFSNRPSAVIPTRSVPDCKYTVLADLGGSRADVALANATAGMSVAPKPIAGGRVKVGCEPRVQHGDRQERIRPNGDGTAFTLQGELPVEEYPWLGFEATLGPNDWLAVGGFANQPDTVGGALFRADANGAPRQRVLVLRVGHVRETPPDDLPAIGKPRGGPSIAAEAGKMR